MSLLMKALEKAAKDRQDPAADNSPAATENSATIPPADGLTLEPIVTPAAGARRPDAVAPPETARDVGRNPARDPARAATVMRAGEREQPGIGAYARDNPLIVLGGVATLFLIGYGAYVYFTMGSPGVFTQQAALSNRPPPAAPPPTVPAATSTANSAPLASLPLLPALQPAKEAPVTAEPLPAVPAAPLAARDQIKIKSGGTTPTLNPALSEAYQALAAGDLETAQHQYGELAKSDPTNPDVWLGLGAIAARRGDSDSATQNYLKTLELDPRNAAAQAGLIGLLGHADLSAAESRLKQLIEREPAPFLYFTLGNVYADQQHWPEAQQAYFQAHHLQPDNADYAYNLAVGLEHVGQPKLAIDFYRLAIDIATAKGRANFSPDAAQERIRRLESAGQ